MATITVNSIEEFFSATANTNSDTILLGSDLDFNNAPLETSKNIYAGMIDGQGHKIANLQPLNISINFTLLSFLTTEMTIKNINFENVFHPSGTLFYLGTHVSFEHNQVSGRCQCTFRGGSTSSNVTKYVRYNAFSFTSINKMFTGGSGSSANWGSAIIENNYIDLGNCTPTSNTGTDYYIFDLYSGTDYSDLNSFSNNYIKGKLTPAGSNGQRITRQSSTFVKSNCFNVEYTSTVGALYISGNADASNIYNTSKATGTVTHTNTTGVTDEQMKNATYLANNTNFPIST